MKGREQGACGSETPGERRIKRSYIDIARDTPTSREAWRKADLPVHAGEKRWAEVPRSAAGRDDTDR